MNWISIVEEKKLRADIEMKLDEIYTVISNFKPVNSFGLLGGYGAIFLFFYAYYQYTKQKKILKLLQDKFSQFYAEFWKTGLGSFSGGYAGICWLIRFLIKEEVLDTENIDDILVDFDTAIEYFMQYDIQKENYDFLHGSLGMAYYYATVGNPQFEDKLKFFMEALGHTMETTATGSVKWLSETYVNYETIGKVYNLSLSHGMAAAMPFLAKVIKTGNSENKELAFKILHKIMLFYKESVNPENFTSTFPKWFEQNNNTPAESPLSWCYGDPGMGQALYNAAGLVEDKELSDLALRVLIKTTKRHDINKEHIKEACFCHGSSSLCHIYNRLYQITKHNVFKEAALFWLNDTLEKGKNDTTLAGYNFFETSNKVNDVNLLAGLSGVGLSLLAVLDTVEPKWDECVLLS